MAGKTQAIPVTRRSSASRPPTPPQPLPDSGREPSKARTHGTKRGQVLRASWINSGRRRRFAAPERPSSTVRVQAEEDDVRRQRTIQRHTSRTPMRRSLTQGPLPRPLTVIARVPHHASDTLTVVTDTAVNADLDLQVVLVHRRLQLSRGVEGSHHDVSTLPPLRVEAVVMNDPSPDRVIHRIHLGHPAHPHASATVNRSNTQAHSGPGSPTSQRSPGQRGTTTRPRGAAAEGPRRSPP